MALFVALGGTSYAAATLAKNSVGSSQIKNHSVKGQDIAGSAITTSKVKNGTLRAADFGGSLPAGPAGKTGPAGPAGPAGGVRAFGRVSQAGVLSRSGGAPVTVTRPSPGVYCLTPQGIDVTKTGIALTLDETGVPVSPDSDQVVAWNANGNALCNPATSFLVNAYQNDTSNTTGGPGPQPKFTHKPGADNAFFFMIP